MARFVEIEPNLFCYQLDDNSLLKNPKGCKYENGLDSFIIQYSFQLPTRVITIRTIEIDSWFIHFPLCSDPYEIILLNGGNKSIEGYTLLVEKPIERKQNLAIFLKAIGEDAYVGKLQEEYNFINGYKGYAFIVEKGWHGGYDVFVKCSELLARRWRERSNYDHIKKMQNDKGTNARFVLKEKEAEKLTGFLPYGFRYNHLGSNYIFVCEIIGTGRYYHDYPKLEIHKRCYHAFSPEYILDYLSNGGIVDNNCYTNMALFFIDKYKEEKFPGFKTQAKELLKMAKYRSKLLKDDILISNIELISFIVFCESKYIQKYGKRS